MKRILTVQDISCVGKCSLTIALPVISAMGVEASVLPTAVLSTHTMFPNCTCKDLSDQIQPITRHWKQTGLEFDAIYTGYLRSAAQIDFIRQLFADFRSESNFVFVDPAMADHGTLYRGFDMEFVGHMAGLCAQADVIVPNLTEACLMTGVPYQNHFSQEDIQELLCKTADLGAGICILTGVSPEEGRTGIAGYDRESGETFFYSREKLPASYHGTGDLFSSVCVGTLAKGYAWQDAAVLAADFTAECIRLTLQHPEEDPRRGVNFEEAIPYLLKRMKA